MSARLKQNLESVDEEEYDAVLLGYALCSGGITGLKARTIPLVVPRAHDCITLFLGSRQRYHDYFFANSGTYFKTTGWIERGSDLEQANNSSSEIAQKLGLNMSRQQFIERYGKENGEYLYEQLTQMRYYSQLTFIETGVEPDDSFERQTFELAARRNWQYEKIQGDLTLLRKLLNGEWDENFLVVPPGKRIDFSYDDDIIKAV